jgi:hypothetical protein
MFQKNQSKRRDRPDFLAMAVIFLTGALVLLLILALFLIFSVGSWLLKTFAPKSDSGALFFNFNWFLREIGRLTAIFIAAGIMLWLVSLAFFLNALVKLAGYKNLDDYLEFRRVRRQINSVIRLGRIMR